MAAHADGPALHPKVPIRQVVPGRSTGANRAAFAAPGLRRMLPGEAVTGRRAEAVAVHARRAHRGVRRAVDAVARTR